MYDYREAIKDDIREWMKDEDFAGMDAEDIREYMNDELWTNDSVTGNGSGSYTCNTEKAREYIMEDSNAEDYIRELIRDYCIDADTIARHFMDWEYWDSSIRCYLLAEAIDEIVDEMEDQEP